MMLKCWVSCEVWPAELMQNDHFLFSYQIPTGWGSSQQLCLPRRRLELELPPQLPPDTQTLLKGSHFTFPAHPHDDVIWRHLSFHWLHRQHGQLIWTGHRSFRPLEVTCDASQEIGFFSPETYRQCEVCIRKKNPCKWNLHFSEIFLPAKDKNVCLRHMDMINSRESHENVGPEENKDIKPQSWLMLFNYLSVW